MPSSDQAPQAPILGSITPRLWTPPLRELTPETSVGFHQIDFARDWLGRPADPWQEWLLIHAGELLPDGRPRFRIVIVLVARQNGKTELLVILSTYWQFVQAVPLILGTSTKLDYARESWDKAVKLVEAAPAPELAELRGRRKWTREANGEQVSWTTEGSRYKIAASNEEGGRSLTVHRLILDELRQHHSYAAWDAAEPATSAVPDAQIWGLSNAGDDKSVVLNDLRDSAADFIRWTDEVGAEHVADLLAEAPGDWRLGLFEWSAPEDADPTDPIALAMANPQYGRRKDPEALLLNAKRAVELGGSVLTGFKTESMCIRVQRLSEWGIFSKPDWMQAQDPQSAVEGRPAFCVGVSQDLTTVTIAAAGLRADEKRHLEVVARFPADVGRVVGWLKKRREMWNPSAVVVDPAGPAAFLIPDIEKHYGEVTKPAARDVSSACSSIYIGVSAAEEAARNVRIRPHPALDAAAQAAVWRQRGDAKAFDRRSDDAADAEPLVCVALADWAAANAPEEAEVWGFYG